MDSQFGPFRIRDWQPTDRETVVALIASILAEFGLNWQPESADQDVVAVEQFYQQTGGEFWVVESTHQPGQLVGTAAFYPSQRHPQAAEIRKMYLLPSVRGKGLGKYLLIALEQKIQAQGYQEVWLETLGSMTAANQLYTRLGYQPSPDVETQRCDRAYFKRFSDD